MAEFIGSPVLVLALANPGAPQLDMRGTPGTTHYGYKVVGFREGDHTAASPEALVTTGPLALSVVNSILITPPLDPHVTSWDVYRTLGGTTQGRIGQVIPSIVDDVQIASFLDYGLIADGEPAPTHNTSGQLYVSEVPGAALFYAGDDGQVLSLIDGLPAWSSGFLAGANPMTTPGDLIRGGSGGTPLRLPIGSAGQVLTMVSGLPAWVTPSDVDFVNPMTTAGDLITGGSSGTPQRLAHGSNGQVLTIASNLPVWATPAAPGFANPMTTAGDLITGGSSGTPQRLGIGSDGQVLTLASGLPAWATPAGGGGTITGSGSTNHLAAFSSGTAVGDAAVGTAIITGLSTGALLYGSSSAQLVQDVTNLAWDSTHHTLLLGNPTSPAVSDHLALTGQLEIQGGPLFVTALSTPTVVSVFDRVGSQFLSPIEFFESGGFLVLGDRALNYDVRLYGPTIRLQNLTFCNDDVVFLNPPSYLNFGGVHGSTGYGFRDNAGVIELKNSGGTWEGPVLSSGGTLTGPLLSDSFLELLSVGSSVNYAGLSGGYYGTPGLLIAEDDGNNRGIDLVSLGNAYLAFNTLLTGFTATAAANTVTVDTDLGVIEWNAFAATSGVVLSEAASIHALVDGTVNATTHVVPGRIELRTADAAGVSQVAVKLDHLQRCTCGGSLLLPAGAYLNFGSTFGSAGYGIRDNGGVLEKKNSGGAWAAL